MLNWKNTDIRPGQTAVRLLYRQMVLQQSTNLENCFFCKNNNIFSFVPFLKLTTWTKMPQIGQVVVHNYVQVYSKFQGRRLTQKKLCSKNCSFEYFLTLLYLCKVYQTQEKYAFKGLRSNRKPFMRIFCEFY
jgi:hypothetical protein